MGAAGLLSRMYFTWASPLIAAIGQGGFDAAGVRKQVQPADLWALRPQERSVETSASLSAAWASEQSRAAARGKPPSLARAMFSIVAFDMLKVFIFKMGWLIFSMLSSSVLLLQVLAFLNDPSAPSWRGAILVLAFFLVDTLRSLCVNQHWLIAVLSGSHIRSAARAMLFDKVLRVRASKSSSGALVNLITNDTQRFLEAASYGEFLVSTPITLLVVLSIMWLQIGPSALAGLAVMLALGPLQARLGACVGRLHSTTVRATDERSKLMAEILTGIKLIKLCGWEAAFADKVARIREVEMRGLRTAAILRTINNVVAFLAPVLVTLVTFATFTLASNDAPLTPSTAFIVLSLFNVARFPLGLMPQASKNVSEALVGARRLQEFLLLPDVPLCDLPVPLPGGGSDEAAAAAVAAAGAPSAVLRVSPLVGPAAAGRAGERSGARLLDEASGGSAAAADAWQQQVLVDDGKLSVSGSVSVSGSGSGSGSVSGSGSGSGSGSALPIEAAEVAASARLFDLSGNGSLPPLDIAIEARSASFEWAEAAPGAPSAGGASTAAAPNGRSVSASSAGSSAAPPPSAQPSPPPVATSPIGTLPAGVSNISFRVHRGECIAIVGDVASGKSSLLAAILGQLRRTGGCFAVRGRIAYAPQAPWVFNGSVRENILFCRPFERERYDAAVAMCALAPDFAQLPAGDLTELGERGLNASGGQKSRISLARAVYADADIYLLDDPLAAVDVRTARALWDGCVTALAQRGKTVLVATHAMHLLAGDARLLLMSGGALARDCTADALRASGGALLTALAESRDEEDPALLAESSPHAGSTRSGGTLASSALASPQPAGALAPEPTALPPPPPPPPPPLPAPAAALPKTLSASLELACALAPVPPPSAPAAAIAAPRAGTALIAAEDRATGAVTLRTVAAYATAAIGSSLAIVPIILVLAAAKGSRQGSDYWLSVWTRGGSAPGGSGAPDSLSFLSVYAGLILGVLLLALLQGLVFVMLTIGASRAFHDRVLSSVMRGTAAWFDSQPTGRILARFTGDLDLIDNLLPPNIEAAAELLLIIGIACAIIAAILPAFLLALIPMGIIFIFVTRVFRTAARELKRLDNASRGPLIVHLQSTLQGMATIRAYGAADRFAATNAELIDGTTSSQWAFYVANRWLACRLDNISSAAAAVTVALCIATRGTLPPSLAALAIVQALATAGIFQYSVRLFTETEAQFTCVERLNYYTFDIPHEPLIAPGAAPLSEAEAGAALDAAIARLDAERARAGEMAVVASSPADAALASSALGRLRIGAVGSESAPPSAPGELRIAVATTAAEPPAALRGVIFAGWQPASWSQALLQRRWPSRGEIVLRDVALRYREGLPLALRGISLRIAPGMRVGCVGRTGSGKTTLSLALFRLMELAGGAAVPAAVDAAPMPTAPSTAGGGAILIDGVDIARVNVYQLRSRLAVLPQDPVLYAGTLRYNLDLFSAHDDAALLAASAAAGLGGFVAGHPLGLGRPVAEGGLNVSHGERQLIALARALLRGARIVVADEATASVDAATDAAVQAAIRASLRGATLLVIAHRLATIIDLDRVLVLAAGELLEYDHPAALLGLAPPREAGRIVGEFARMVADAGPEAAAALKLAALESAAASAL